MKKIYAIIIQDKKLNIRKEFRELDKKQLTNTKKILKKENPNSKIKIIDVWEIFENKKLFLKVIELYLKNLKSSWFVNYFDIKNLKYSLNWFDDIYIEYISKNYQNYLEKVPETIFKNFINKELFFSIIKSNISTKDKIKILDFYKETFERITKIKKGIMWKIISNIFIIWWAVWLYFFLNNSIIPQVTSLLSNTWNWVNPGLIFIKTYWIYFIITILLILTFYLWMFFYNWNTFFKTFKFITIQYKLFRQINTMQLLLTSMLINTLNVEKIKSILAENFDWDKNKIKWNSFKEILDEILNEKEKMDIFLPEYVLSLKSMDTTDFNSYIENLWTEINNLNEDIEETKEFFLWVIKQTIFISSALIMLIWVMPLFLVMKSIMEAVWHMMN